MRIAVNKVASGEALARVAYEANGYLFNADERISEEAKDVAACVFDYLRDLGDIGDEVPSSDRLTYQRELDGLFSQLVNLGCSLFRGVRHTRLTNHSWVDKAPLPFTIGYLTVAPSDISLSEMMVPRRVG